jgi:hypothetical protein
MLAGLITIATYLLGQTINNTEVTTHLLDETFRKMVLSELRVHPTAYYSIVDALYRQLYSAQGVLFANDFPLMFYIWLLVPNVGDIKWLYLVFALAGTVASYFTVYSVTKQSLVAVLSAVGMAYFLETSHYLMYEQWAISIFLIGLAFLARRHYVSGAAAIGVAALIREVFAPFMVIASLYYFVVSIEEWWPSVSAFLRRRFVGKWRILRFTEISKSKQAYAWFVATCVVGSLMYLNGLASTGGHIHFSHSPLTTNEPGLKLEALPLLFADGCCYQHALPPVPAIVVILLSLIGIAFLDKDQSIIMYSSLALLPLLILLGVVGYGPGFGGVYSSDNVPRWNAMSITIVNLFWLTGASKIEYIYTRMQRKISLRQSS